MQDWKLTDKNYRGWKMTDIVLKDSYDARARASWPMYVGLRPDRYMTISVHTISVHVFRQIRNLDHFGTCTTSVRVSRVPRRYIPLRYNATSVHYTPRTLRDAVGP